MLTVAVVIVFSGLFTVHAYKTISRYLEYKIQQVQHIKQNSSLSLPTVTLLFNIYSADNSTSDTDVQFGLWLDGKNFPRWGYSEGHFSDQHYVDANVADNDYLVSQNLTLEDRRGEWPLQTHYTNSINRGIAVAGYFDATKLLEFIDGNKSALTIRLYIQSFESDPASNSAIGIPYYQLMPCEQLIISLALEHHTLINRTDRPCRDDYPDALKMMLKKQMTTNLFYNPIFAPNLPYSQETCRKLCEENFWLSKCSCYGNPAVRLYAGQPENMTCPEYGPNCTLNEDYKIPSDTINECKCYPTCKSYRFHVAGDDKIRYSYGKGE